MSLGTAPHNCGEEEAKRATRSAGCCLGVWSDFGMILGLASGVFPLSDCGFLPVQQWQMSVGVSEDSGLFSCSIWRPQGKSYLFFTQFKAEVKGAKIEHAMAYVSPRAAGTRAVPPSAVSGGPGGRGTGTARCCPEHGRVRRPGGRFTPSRSLVSGRREGAGERGTRPR
uniref:Uncharacterized protein n=1 Tax=Malurus cyaneus samueli TaxID=2593467 RepID=A0A8C5U5M2_9PASS